MDVLKVSAQSDSTATAGALANTVRQNGEAELQGIGPKAVNQAVKAIAIARSYLASSGIDLVAIPSFVDVEIDGEPRTALRFSVKPRHLLMEEKAQRAGGVLEEAEREAPVAVEEPEPLESADLLEEQPREAPSLSEVIAGRPVTEDEEPVEEPPPGHDLPEADLDREGEPP